MTQAFDHKCPRCQTHYTGSQECDWCEDVQTVRIPDAAGFAIWDLPKQGEQSEAGAEGKTK